MKVLAVALLLGCAVEASAQEERAIDNFAGVGVRAMGMGGAFAAVADDFTAMYWNPAGLAQMNRREVRLSFLRNSRDTESTLGGVPGQSDLSNTRFGTLGFVFPYPVYQGSLVFAAGFTRIKDFDWNLNLRGTEDGLTRDDFFQHEGELSLAGISSAIDVSPAVSLGATVGLVSGENQRVNEFNGRRIARAREESGTDPQDESPEDEFREVQRYFSRDTFSDAYHRTFYAVLGMMVRAPRDGSRYRLGMTLTTSAAHKIRYAFRGVSDEYGYSLIEYDDGTVEEYPVDNFSNSYELSLPFEFAVSGSAEIVQGLMLAGSLHYAEWSQSEYGATDDGEFRASTSFETQYQDVLRYHLGVEYKVPTIALDLRAGYYTDPIPFIGPRDLDPVTDFPPIKIDEDRAFFTLGAGLLLDGVVQVDAAWMRGSFKQTEQLEDIIVEDHKVDRLFVGVGYSF